MAERVGEGVRQNRVWFRARLNAVTAVTRLSMQSVTRDHGSMKGEPQADLDECQ